MLLLHSAVSEETGRTVIGYAVKEKGKYFIIMKDGTREVVRMETFMPYEELHRIEDYVNLPEQVINGFHSRNAFYLEDLSQWKDEDYDKVRGIGKSRKNGVLKVIQNVLL